MKALAVILFVLLVAAHPVTAVAVLVAELVVAGVLLAVILRAARPLYTPRRTTWT